MAELTVSSPSQGITQLPPTDLSKGTTRSDLEAHRKSSSASNPEEGYLKAGGERSLRCREIAVRIEKRLREEDGVRWA
jgi:hypothetical protein